MEQLEIFDYDYSDLGNGEKKCSKCNNFLPLTSFGKSDGGNYLRAECRSCTNKLQKVRKDITQEKEKTKSDTTNNSIFVGSTAELQKFLKTKDIKDVTDV